MKGVGTRDTLGLGAFSFNLWFLPGCSFVAGMGIGGEYTAINSAIDELIPSHYRGRVDIAVNGTYWAGAAIGAFASIFLLNPHLLPINLGWRLEIEARVERESVRLEDIATPLSAASRPDVSQEAVPLAS